MGYECPKELKEIFEKICNDLDNYVPTDDEVWDEETQANWDAKMESVK